MYVSVCAHMCLCLCVLLLHCEIDPNHYTGQRQGQRALGGQEGTLVMTDLGMWAALGWIMENNMHGSQTESEAAAGPGEAACPGQRRTLQRSWKSAQARAECSPEAEACESEDASSVA